MPASSLISQFIDKIKKRSLGQGGFADQESGTFRPDATAWAALAFSMAKVLPEIFEAACLRLQRCQLKDGRIPVSSDHPEAFWPTPIAILAWQGSDKFNGQVQKASRFLLNTTGLHFKKKTDSPTKHDPSIRGWPWIENTHSWIEPTCLSVMALESIGLKNHERVREAVEMIKDRQLPKGGWNYGNTLVFDSELEPFPDTTGIALSALIELVPRPSVDRSLVYLKMNIENTKTPISLGWAILGLSAWNEKSSEFNRMILECLSREEMFGAYSTTAYSLLALSLLAPHGIKNFIKKLQRP
jgi:hypothetical protein